MAKLPQSCGAATAVGALGLRAGGARSIKPCVQQSLRQHWEPGLGTHCLWWQGGEATSCTDLWTDMELDVQRAKELIEQKLAEEEEKVGPWGRGTCLGCVRDLPCAVSILGDLHVRRLALTLPPQGMQQGDQGLSAASGSLLGSSCPWGKAEQQAGAQLAR